MPENEGAGAATGDEVIDNGAGAGGEGEGAGEGTTPEEVRQILNLPDDPAAPKPKAGEGEEGDDPDEPAAGAGEGDDPVETDEEREARETEEATAEEERIAQEAADKKKKAEELAAAADEDPDAKYAFEVTDGEGVTFKILPGAKMEEILAEFTPKNNGQILDILNQLQKAEANKASDEKAAEAQTAEAAHATRIQELQDNWRTEVTDLKAQKRIPDGEEGTERVNKVYSYMAEENQQRIKDSKPTISSFEDALDKLEAKEAREAKAQAAKDAKTGARKNGALVGGSSAPAAGNAKVYKAGTARNSSEAIRAMGLLD